MDDPARPDRLNLLTCGGAPCLAFQKVDESPRSTWPASIVPQQLRLDLAVGDVNELAAVQDPVIDLVGEPRLDRADSADEPLRVCADLDGRPFCVFVAESAPAKAPTVLIAPDDTSP